MFSWYTCRVVQYILYIYKSIKNIHKNFVNSVYTRVGNESLVPDFLDIPHLLCTVYSTVHDVPQDYIIPYSILRKISWYFLEISSANNSIIENTVGISHEIFYKRFLLYKLYQHQISIKLIWYSWPKFNFYRGKRLKCKWKNTCFL